MNKLFVRERRHVGQGAGRPRFAIVAAYGADLQIYKTRVRRAELEKMAAEIGAEIIYLPRGESEAADAADTDDIKASRGRRRHHKRD